MENGIRALFLESKPHSKGEDFSRSVKVFLEIIKLIVIINILIIKIIILIYTMRSIIYTYLRSIDWKSTIIIYTI